MVELSMIKNWHHKLFYTLFINAISCETWDRIDKHAPPCDIRDVTAKNVAQTYL